MAGTEKTTVPQPASSGIGEITDLVKLLTGTQTSSTQSGDTGALSSIIAELTANNPAQQQAVLQSIFQQAAGKIPGIMGNTYNATGSRGAPGQLTPQLQELMSQVTLAAQQQMAAQSLQNSQQRISAAQTIANANRSATTKEHAGGQSFLQDAAKLLATADVAKKLTGFDAIAKTKDGVKSLIDMIAGDAGGGSPGDIARLMSSVDFNSNDPTNVLTGADWASLGDSAVSGVSRPTEIALALQSLDSASPQTVDFSSLISSNDVNAVTDWNGNPDGSQLSTSDWDQLGADASNFSSGSDAAASSGSGTNYGSYLKVADYIDKPEKAKDIFDLSDGDWKDDISDVTDAGAIVLPPLAAVRPALNMVDAQHQEMANFVTDPNQWWKDVIGGDSPLVNAHVDMANGIVQSVVGTGDMLGRATETAGNAVGDLAQGIGDSVGDFFGGSLSFGSIADSVIGDIFGW